MTFDELGLSPWLLEAIQTQGYEHPTSIQAQTIPLALTGRDVLGIAQTGTGKTGAFCFPILEYLSKGRLRARMPRALILTPTRELALQIEDNIRVYSQKRPITTALLVGGSSLNDQATLLSRGVDIIVATPGRLLDHLQRGRILTGDIRFFVIDEADRMMDMGFIDDIEIIVKRLPIARQTLLFSATMPEAIKTLAQTFMIDPAFVQINPTSPSAELVTQWRLEGSVREKKAQLICVIERENFESLIIFCNRKRDISPLVRHLQAHVQKPIQLGVLHGDLSQEARMEAVRRFKEGQINVMVASDVASRGLDIAGMSHVINFDVPIHADEYIHRIGRTGRAGRSGVAITFVTEAEYKAFRAILNLIKKEIPLYPNVASLMETVETPHPTSKQQQRNRKKKKEKAEQEPSAPSQPSLEGSKVKEMNHIVGFGDFIPSFMRCSS